MFYNAIRTKEEPMRRDRITLDRNDDELTTRRVVREFSTLVLFFGTIYFTALYAHAIAG